METGWDGVRVKSLFYDPVRKVRTMLMRMESGASYPPHSHGADEQCMVLEGDVRCGDLVLHAGDFQCLPANSRHEETNSVNGCLLLITASDHNAVLM